MSLEQAPQPIAVYDSGVGGLSVLRALLDLLPHEQFLYLGDQANVPYGDRSLKELRGLAEGVTRFFLEQNAKIIVIACNTASAAALRFLRQQYPHQLFVGMEPAVKPAAEQTHSHKVGVLATPSTFQGELYASVVERFANGVEIFQNTCPGLVKQIEKGELDSPQTIHILHQALDTMLEQGVDKIVLACTHFPFVIPQIEKILAGRATVIDPAPAVARQTARVLEAHNLLSKSRKPGRLQLFTTGDTKTMGQISGQLISLTTPAEALVWQQNRLCFPD